MDECILNLKSKAIKGCAIKSLEIQETKSHKSPKIEFRKKNSFKFLHDFGRLFCHATCSFASFIAFLLLPLNDLKTGTSLSIRCRRKQPIPERTQMINRRHFVMLQIFKFHYKQNYDSTQSWFIDLGLNYLIWGLQKVYALCGFQTSNHESCFQLQPGSRKIRSSKMIHHFMNYCLRKCKILSPKRDGILRMLLSLSKNMKL